MKKNFVLKKLSRFALAGLFLLLVQTSFAGYTCTVSPTTAPLGVPTVFTFTLTSGAYFVGGAEMKIPAGVTGPAGIGSVMITAPAGKNWVVASVSPTLIRFRANSVFFSQRLEPGKAVTLQFTATINTAGPKEFTTRAYSNPYFFDLNINNDDGFIFHIGTLQGGQPTVNATPIVCTPPVSRLYVDGSVAVSGNGGTWACAIKELRDAVTVAAGNAAITQIWVAEGTYKPTAGADRNATMLITRNNLAIYGGFASGATSLAEADPINNLTTISGDIGAAADASDNSYHLFTIRNVPAGVGDKIDGFLMTGGNATAAGTTGGSGGALLAYDNAPISVSRCVFSQNRSILYGGAVFTTRSDVTFTYCIFNSNTSASGGGMYGWFSSPSITSSAFVGNTATLSGGGYYGNFGTPTFRNTVFGNNTAVAEGGAVYQNQSGGVYDNCLFNANSSEWSGGIHQHNGSASTVRNCTFFANTASNTQGAGGILLNINCTTDTRNSIFWKNRKAGADNVIGADVKNTFNTVNIVNYNMLQANSGVNTGAANTVGVDPMFVNEADPDGPDNLPATADDGLQLSSVSVGLNSGDNGVAATFDVTSISPRVVCSVVDRGAYESQACGAAPTKNAVTQNVKKELDPATGVVANPFTNELQVRYNGTDKAALNIYDVSGKPAYNKTNIAKGVTRVDASSWGRGMYQVVISTASGQKMVFKAMKM